MTKDMEKTFIKDITCFGATTLGERGQIVVPVEIRNKLKVKKGEKFVAFLTPSEAIVFIPSNRFGNIISELNKKLTKLKSLSR